MYDIVVNFDNEEYKMILTNHSKQRMTERGLSILQVKDSIEEYDISYKKSNKEVVEKNTYMGIIKTIFTIEVDNIILITTMIVGK